MTRVDAGVAVRRGAGRRGLRDRHARRHRRRHRPRRRRPVGARPGRLLSPRQRPLAEDDRVPARQGLPRLVRSRSTTRSRSQLRGLVEKAAQARANADERASPTCTRASSTRPRSSAPASRRSPASWRRSTRCSRRASSRAVMGRHERGSASACRCGMYIDQDARDARATCRRSSRPASACPTATTTSSPTTPSSRTRARATLAYLTRLLELSRAPRRRGDVGARRARARDGARAGPVDAGRERAIRSRPTTGSTLAALAPLAPGFDWPAWLAATGLAGKTGDVDRPPAELPARPSPRSCRRRRCRSGRPTCAPTCSARTRRSSPRTSSTRASRSSARRCRARPRTCRAGSAASASSKRRRANRSASSTSTPTSRRRRRRAWKSSSPTCSPRIARASTRSTG